MTTVFCARGPQENGFMDFSLAVGTEFETALLEERAHGRRPKLYGVRAEAKAP